MSFVLNGLGDLEAWSLYLQGLVGFTGDPVIIEGFDWTGLSVLTVGDYLDLLDAVEAQMQGYDWSILGAQLPKIRRVLYREGLDRDEVDEMLGVLQDFVDGDLSLITDAFDLIRGYLSPYPAATVLALAVDGSVSPGEGGLVFTGDGGNDDILGTGFRDKLKGAGGHDEIRALDGNDKVFGGAGRDDIHGGAGRDVLSGGGGRDTIRGGTGNDSLLGGGGDDRLFGGRGTDVIRGDGGRDQLFGGSGADEFRFGSGDGKDRIMDFEAGTDRIRFEGAASLEDLDFRERAGKGWTEVSHDGVVVIVEGVTEAELALHETFFDF